MHVTPVRLGFLCLVVVLGPACGPATPPAPQVRSAAASGQNGHGHDHDDHDHAPPASFADGVKRLETLAHNLGESMTDEGVHEIGHLLEEVRESAKKLSSAPADDAAAIAKALDDLEECFGKVDEAFHSGDEKADPKQVLESVRERIEGAFKTIREVL